MVQMANMMPKMVAPSPVKIKINKRAKQKTVIEAMASDHTTAVIKITPPSNGKKKFQPNKSTKIRNKVNNNALIIIFSLIM